MARALSPAAIEEGTGRAWPAWVELFEAAGGGRLTHRELVDVASTAGAPAWWRQMVAVTYEQHLGRRVPNQAGDGTFSVSASRTLAGTMDEALARWEAAVGPVTVLSGIPVESGPDVRRTDRWRYWRCALADGSRVAVNISERSAGKAVVAVDHGTLDSAEAVDHWRAYWKGVLAGLEPSAR